MYPHIDVTMTTTKPLVPLYPFTSGILLEGDEYWIGMESTRHFIARVTGNPPITLSVTHRSIKRAVTEQREQRTQYLMKRRLSVRSGLDSKPGEVITLGKARASKARYVTLEWLVNHLVLRGYGRSVPWDLELHVPTPTTRRGQFVIATESVKPLEGLKSAKRSLPESLDILLT